MPGRVDTVFRLVCTGTRRIVDLVAEDFYHLQYFGMQGEDIIQIHQHILAMCDVIASTDESFVDQMSFGFVRTEIQPQTNRDFAQYSRGQIALSRDRVFRGLAQNEPSSAIPIETI